MTVTWTGYILVGLFLGGHLCVDAAAASAASCAQEKLQGCTSMATALLEDSRLAFPATREEVEGTCKSWTKLLTCMDDYVNDCMNDNEKSEFKQAVGGILEGVRRLCSDPEYQAQYFQHADCIKRTYTEDGMCGTYYGQLARQVSHEMEASALCCNLRKFETCVVSTTSANCGTTAKDFISALLDKTMGYLVKKCANVQYMDQCSVANDVAPFAGTSVTTPSPRSPAAAPGTGTGTGSGAISIAGIGQGPPNAVHDTRSAHSETQGPTPTSRWSLTRQPETLAYGGSGNGSGSNSATSNSRQAAAITGTISAAVALLLTALHNRPTCAI